VRVCQRQLGFLVAVVFKFIAGNAGECQTAGAKQAGFWKPIARVRMETGTRGKSNAAL